MVVYIEDAIFDTCAINFVILALSLFALRQKVKFLRIFLASSFGCAVSVALTFLNLPDTINFLLKVLTGLTMCLIASPKFNFKALALLFVVFLSVTFIMGGFCFFVIYLFGGEVYSLQNLSYNLPIPLGVISLLLGIYVFFLSKAVVYFYKKQRLENFCYDVELTLNNTTLKLNAFLDTGNLIEDEKTGKPILIVNFLTFNKFFNNKLPIIAFLNSHMEHTIKGRYVTLNTVNSSSKIFVVEPQSVILKDGKTTQSLDVLIGVSSNLLASKFDLLLSPLAINLGHRIRQ